MRTLRSFGSPKPAQDAAQGKAMRLRAATILLSLLIFIATLAVGGRFVLSALYVFPILLSVRTANIRDVYLTTAGALLLTALSLATPDWPSGRGEAIMQTITVMTALAAVGACAACARLTCVRLKAERLILEQDFDGHGVAMWRQDWSRLGRQIHSLKSNGVTDFASYIGREPAFVAHARRQIVTIDINSVAVDLFAAASKQELLKAWSKGSPEDDAFLVQAILAWIDGATTYQSCTACPAMSGSQIDVRVVITFPSAFEALGATRITAVDISAERALQAALARTQSDLAHAVRTATVGALSASIVHELNQPLAAIVLNAQAARRWLLRDEPDLDQAAAAMSRVVKNAEQASELIGRTRSFLSKGAGQPERLAVHDLIAEAVELVSPQLRRGKIALLEDVPKDLPTVEGDRLQIQQVIVNLLINAAHAMPASFACDRRRIGVVVRRDDEAIVVRVEDTGTGFDEADLERLFEPYFTTKTDGVGLGLAISRSSVEAHGGRLWATREPEGGSAFHFTLPIARSEAA